MFIIYKVHHPEDDTVVYYGKTTTSLKVRLQGHRTLYSCPSSKYRGSTCRIVFDHYGIDNCTITELYRTDNADEAKHMERNYIINNPCVNRCVPLRSKYEWEQLHRDQRRSYHKMNDKRRADKRKMKMRCECGKMISYRHRFDHYKTKGHINQQTLLDS